ncbi:MAG: cytochrome-c oxidase, cbb3-type subunit III [Pseudomonadota bacterium]
MSSFWSALVTILVVGNILAMVWLLFGSNKLENPDDDATTGHIWDGIQELNNPLPRWWMWLFVLTILFSAIYLVVFPGLGAYQGTLGWSQNSQFEKQRSQNRIKQEQYFSQFKDLDISELSHQTKAMDTAGRLFAQNCATCHGSDAGGAIGYPSLRDQVWLYGGSGEQIVQSISLGRAGMMPDLNLSERDIAVLAEYVKHLSGVEVSDYVKQVGPKRFIVCTACHGPDAKGNQHIGAPDLTDREWVHGNSHRQIAAVLRNGVQGNMPSFRTLLSELEIKFLAAYLLSLSEVQEPNSSTKTAMINRHE